jgi:hypothetical protein
MVLKIKTCNTNNAAKKQASGAAKTAALERSVRFREGKLEEAKWHLQKVTLELHMLKDELKHVEKLPVHNSRKKQ